MRIGIDGRDLFRNEITGIGRYVLNFLKSIKGENGTHKYILFLNEKNYCDIEASYIEKIVIKEIATFLWDQFLLVSSLKKERVDIFYSPYFKAPIFTSCKVIVSILDIIPFEMEPYKSSMKMKLNRVAIRIFSLKATKILTISQYSKGKIIEYLNIPSEKVEVIYPGIDKDFMPIKDPEKILLVKNRYGISGNYILYVGNLKPHKNLSKLLEAYSLLHEDIKAKFQLVIGGKKDKAYDLLLKETKGRGIEGKVIFTDFIPDRDLPSLYNGATLFVFPSLYEGFGLPILEAMSCGVPVVASNSTSIPEIVGDAAILVDPKSAKDFTKAISNVIEDIDFKNKMISKGLERAMLFSIDEAGKKMIKFFENI